MMPTVTRVYQVVLDEAEERSRRERVTPEDIAIRVMTHHKIRPLLPDDLVLQNLIGTALRAKARGDIGRIRDKAGNRLILSPVQVGPVDGPRGYLGREAMTVAQHTDLGQVQIIAGTRKRTEGVSRVTAAAQAISLGRSMSDPLGELAATVSADEPTDEASGGDA